MNRFALRSLLMVSMALAGSTPAWGADVSAETAAKVGYAFAQQNALLKEVVTGVGEATAYGARWVVPLLPQGYVLVESDDTRKPIVAFSTEDFPATENIPEAMAAMLYREAEATASESTTQSDTPSAVALTIGEEEAVSTTETPHGDWALLSGESSADEGEIMLLTIDEPTSVATIRQLTNQTVRWDQSLPYNLYAPGLSEEVMSSGYYETWVNDGYIWSYGSRSPVGCVATATAQVAQFCEWPYRLRTPISSQKSGDSSSLASWQVAVPGEPYDWASIGSRVSESTYGYADEPYGAEVARLIQHWGTGSSMTYWRTLTGATTTAYAVDDVLEEAFGYQMVASAATWWGNDIADVYKVFRKAVIEYSLPVATGVPGHEVVVAGWAEAVDGTLTSDNCYAWVNYGWGNWSGMTGWYTLAESSSTASSGDAVLYDAFLRVPLPYGEVTAASGNSVTWYESPYWMNRQSLDPISSRTLRRVAFDTSAMASRSVDLQAFATSDSNWLYDASTGLTRTKSVNLSASAYSGDAFLGGTSVDFTLTRRTDDCNSETTTDWASVWENQGCTLTLRVLSLNDGATLQESQVQLGTDLTSGTVSIDLNISSTIPWRMELVSGASSNEATATIPYYINAITVAGTSAATEESVTFTLSGSPDSTTGLYTQTLSELSELASGVPAVCAMQIGTEAGDVMWSPCLTQAAPTVTWGVGKETETNGWRFWLPTPETEISFTVADSDSTALSSVTAYLSNTLWLDPAVLTSSDGLGIPLTPTSTGDGTWACTFTLPPNPDTSVVDRLSLDSSTAAGRDVVLALKVVDAEGNVTWTHARMTFGIPENALASSTDARGTTSAVSAISADNILGSLHVANTSLSYSDLIACYTAAVDLRYTESELTALVANAVAESDGFPTPAVASESFDGALSPYGFSWTENEQPTTYVTSTPFSQGFAVADSVSPYVESLSSGTTSGVWSAAVVAQGAIALVANVDDVDVTNSMQRVLWDGAPQPSYTSTANTLLCVVTADSTGAKVIQLLYIASDASDPIVLQQASIPSSVTGYHVITATFSSSGVTLAVDDQLGSVPDGTTLPSTLTFSLNNFQLGNIYGGTTRNSATISGLETIGRASGAIIDELRFYGTALSSATAVYAAVKSTLTPAGSYARTLSVGANTWSDANWTGADTAFPSDGTAEQVTLTVEETSTLAVDQTVTMNTLTLSGAGALTLEGSSELTASATQVGVNTTISSGVAALGAVTLNATLTLGQASIASTFLTSLSGSGTLTLSGGGTVILPDGLASFTGTLQVTDNTTLDLSAVTSDLSSVTLSVEAGSKVILSDLSASFADTSEIASGATVQFDLHTLSFRLAGGTFTTPSYIADGALIVIGSTTYTATAGTTLTFTGEPTYTGSDWYWDFEFQDDSGNSSETNTGSSATAFTWDGTYPFQGNEYAAITTGNYGLHLQARPYLEAGVPTESTAVMRLRAFPADDKILVSFGSQATGTVTLLTGSEVATTGALRLIHTDTNHAIDASIDVTILNATAAYHLYAFIFRTVDGITQVSLSVDGVEVATLENLSGLGSAFQFANIHGGLASFGSDTGLSSDASVCTDTTLTEALVDFFRVSEGALTEDAIAALVAAYPYISPNGEATRTVSATEAWSATDGSTPWTQTDSNGTSTAQAAPDDGTVINLTFSGTATLTQNLSVATTYESLALTGSGDSATLSIAGATDVAMLTVQGETTLSGGTVTLDVSCISLGTLTVEEGAALVLDCSGLDFTSGEAITLTGYVNDASYARLSVSGLPTEVTASPYTWALTHASTGEAQLVPTLKDAITCFTADVTSAGTTFSSLGWTWTIDGTTSTQTTVLPAAYTGALVLTNTSGAADASVTIDSAQTAFSLTVSGAMTLSGLANLTTSGTIALNSSVTLADTTIAQNLSIAQGCTLTFAPAASATFSGTLSGSGAATIAGDITFTQGQTSFSGALSVSSGTLTFNTSADPTLPYSTLSVAEGATLDLRNAKGYFSVTGQGTLLISGVATLRCASAGNAYDVRNVVIASGATLTFETTYGSTALSPVNLTVEGTLTGGSNGVSVSGTLAGSGTIAKNLTFGDGATLTANSSPLTVSGTLICSGALNVTLPSGTDFSTANAVTLISGSSVSAPSSATVTLDGATRSDILVTTSSAGLIALLPELPTQAEGETASSTLDTTAQAVLREAMVTQNTTTLDKVVGYTKTGKTEDGASAPETIDTQAINNALTLFTDILTLSTETSGETSVTTATVTYNFGVTGITVKALDPDNSGTSANYVILTVAVTDGSTNSTADFADGTSVVLSLADSNGGTMALSATEVTDVSGATAFIEGTHTRATGIRYFRVPMASLSGTSAFSVSATNE